jgi:hypothetical protein
MNKKTLCVLSVWLTFALVSATSVYANEATSTKKSDKATSSSASEQHRSVISSFVQTLWNSSSRLNGIGDKIREIAQEQSISGDKVSNTIDIINNRSSLKTFLIGTDYKNLGVLRSSIASTTNNLNQLNRELDKLATTSDKTVVINEIKLLEAEQVKLNDFVKNNESKFSLFGWFVKLFSK